MPMFKVWWPDQGQEKEQARAFKALNPEHAAECWADWYDSYSNDFLIVAGEVATVKVLQEDCGVLEVIKVRGWQSREYAALAV